MKRKKIILLLFYIITFSSLIYSTILLINWIKDNNNISNETKEIKKVIKVTKKNSNENSKIINAPEENDRNNDYWEFIKKDFNNVDFTELKNLNSDTVAWIKINNTNINYPVVQTKDNNFYLNHSFKKGYNDAGWIFMDYRNNDFYDKNTIIYGHSRLDKSMFGTLKNVMKKDWQNNKDNHVIFISTKTENTLWQVFSTYYIKTENYYIQTAFSNENKYQEFLDKITSRSNYDYKVHPNTKDKIITLSTCHNKSEKTVLHAKLIKKQDK